MSMNTWKQNAGLKMACVQRLCGDGEHVIE